MNMSPPIQIPSEIVEKWQEIVNLLAEIMHVPAALIMRVEPPNIKVFVSSESRGNPYEPDEVACLNTGLYCETVMKTRKPLLVPDALVDDDWKSNPDIKLGMISYLGFPLTWPDGEIFGTICVLDNKRNEYSELYRRLLMQCREVLQADLRSVAKARWELQASEERYRELINLSSDGIYVFTEDGICILTNPAGAQLAGCREDQLIGTSFADTYAPAERHLLSQRMQKSKEGSLRFERWFLRRNGDLVPVEVCFSALHGAYQAVVRDVSARKRAEAERERLRHLEADLAHVNRVSMMGELAASLAHEIKQPISAAATNAKTCLRWLERQPPEIEEARETASRIVNNVNRAADIIDRLHSLYTKGAQQRELVNVNEVIEEMIVLLRSEASRYSIPIRSELAENLPQLIADRVQLQQVLMNLMLNAIEAMKERTGNLTIRSERTEDGQLLISISDTGIGLPGENLDEIFNPFFTTKPQGTGMGLAISRSIVESHGGRLWASANGGGQGATFHFTLPSEARRMHDGRRA